MDLTGKHALVTGGGTGIGLAIAKALAGAGAEVTITGRRQNVLEDVAEANMFPAAMDVTDEAQVVKVIDDAVAARGPIQICVPNAGVAIGKKLHKTDTEFWRQIMATNLDGVFFTIRESMRSMLTTDWGRVIAVSSIAGLRGMPGGGAYAASKHGVIGMVRSISEDFMGQPYTFNSLCPGYVDTDIITRNVESISQRSGMNEEQARDVMVQSNRHKRLIAAEEVGAAALWLCDNNSGSVNGQEIQIAGGKI